MVAMVKVSARGAGERQPKSGFGLGAWLRIERRGDVKQDRRDPEVDALAARHGLDRRKLAERRRVGGEVDAELFVGFAAGGVGEVAVIELAMAAGKRNLAGPWVAVAGAALHEQHFGVGAPAQGDGDGGFLGGPLLGR